MKSMGRILGSCCCPCCMGHMCRATDSPWQVGLCFGGPLSCKICKNLVVLGHKNKWWQTIVDQMVALLFFKFGEVILSNSRRMGLQMSSVSHSLGPRGCGPSDSGDGLRNHSQTGRLFKNKTLLSLPKSNPTICMLEQIVHSFFITKVTLFALNGYFLSLQAFLWTPNQMDHTASLGTQRLFRVARTANKTKRDVCMHFPKKAGQYLAQSDQDSF